MGHQQGQRTVKPNSNTACSRQPRQPWSPERILIGRSGEAGAGSGRGTDTPGVCAQPAEGVLEAGEPGLGAGSPGSSPSSATRQPGLWQVAAAI